MKGERDRDATEAFAKKGDLTKVARRKLALAATSVLLAIGAVVGAVRTPHRRREPLNRDLRKARTPR